MSSTQPNILLIILDTQRRDRLSLYGAARENSPALDAFAQQSTVFERAVAPAQWTVPSHASIFTGRYAGAHGVTEASHVLSGLHPTLAEILQVGGYRTVGFCNNPLVGLLENGFTRGFDAFYNYAGTAPERPHHAHHPALRRAMTARWRQFAASVQHSFAHSDALFNLTLNPLLVPLWTRFIRYKGNTAYSLQDALNVFVSHTSGGNAQPLFSFINLMGTHLPYHPSKAALQQTAPYLLKNNAEARFLKRFNSQATRWASPPDTPLQDWEVQTLLDAYDAEIREQDALLGQFLADLEQRGLLDNTMVIIAADHGESHGDHGFIGHSFVVYQELVHVPLIVRYPERFPNGKRVMTNVSTRRIFHTVLDAAGLIPPLDEADPNAAVGELTLANSVNGRPDPEGGMAFSEAFPPQTFLSVMRHRAPHMIDALRLTETRRGLYDGAHKLTTIGGAVDGLFDLTHDPQEVNSVAAEQPQRTAQLYGALERFRAQVGSGGLTSGSQDIDPGVLNHLRALGYVE